MSERELRRRPTAAELADVRGMHEANRVAWDEAASEYAAQLPEAIAFIRAGGTNLEPPERAHLGDLRGRCRRAIHLQCASGRDTLSLWNLGAAEVVGVDISERHVENARRLADAVGAPARFVRADVLDTPSDLDGSADLVYTGKGALFWLHDLADWARVVARLLAPGGRLYVFEGHPFLWLFDETADTWRWSGLDYFDLVEASQGWPAVYLEDFATPAAEQATKFARGWTMGAIVTAVAEAGLRIERLTEHPDEYCDLYRCIAPADRGKVPRTFSLLARKTA
jgi:SAM-dependent methyltransferase